MDWITENVAVGSWEDAANHDLMKKDKIGAILNVRDDEDNAEKKEENKREWEYCVSEKIAYEYLPVPDFQTATDNDFVSGIAFIEAFVRLRRKVLVHCGAGLGLKHTENQRVIGPTRAYYELKIGPSARNETSPELLLCLGRLPSCTIARARPGTCT